MDAGDLSMLDLFRIEVEQQTAVLSENLLALEQDVTEHGRLDDLMRAAHSIKGAARLVNVPPAAKVAHVMEDVFVAAQQGRLLLNADHAEALLQGTDLLAQIGALQGSPESWMAQHQKEFDVVLSALGGVLRAVSTVVKETSGYNEETQLSGSCAPGNRSCVALPSAIHGGRLRSPHLGILSGADEDLHQANDLKDAAPIDPSMLALFRTEVEQQAAVLTEGLLSLEQNPVLTEYLESMMRAAHSIKGAARLVGIPPIVNVAHLMEDSFVAAQAGELIFQSSHVDALLKGVDMISRIAVLDESVDAWVSQHQALYDSLLAALKTILSGEAISPKQLASVPMGNPETSLKIPVKEHENAPKDRVLRVSADQLNRLMGLAGEAMIESNWLRPYTQSMMRLKRKQTELAGLIDKLSESLEHNKHGKKAHASLREIRHKVSSCREFLAERLSEIESFDNRLSNLSWRLRREVVTSRMRPFGDGVHGFARMVRDVARSLGKDATLEIKGQEAMVDREILEKMEAPLNHLLRNAVDHGIESPEERAAAEKPAKGTLRLSACHQAGMLSIVIEDDGRGVNIEKLRAKVRDRGLVTPDMAANLTEEELLAFLFLPGFTTRDAVTEISGRGVGLDVVHDTVQKMRGMVRVTSRFGKGTRFQMQLPLTLSVIPALLVDIAGEPYAFPLVRIQRILRLEKSHIESIGGHQYANIEGRRVGLVSAAQILDMTSGTDPQGSLCVVVIGDRDNCYGLVVEHFIGERDLVIHALPKTLGKVNDISAAALMEDGSPILIIDVDDMLRSIEVVVKQGRLSRIDDDEIAGHKRARKNILVVDDSITVREVERKLLENNGYKVDVAVDGMDGWNAVRSGTYDMVITDIDMPRMDGIELVHLIKKDIKLKNTPVMIMSYKARAEDRHRGLNAGANYYLTKGSFHDDTLLQAVRDLIGEAV